LAGEEKRKCIDQYCAAIENACVLMRDTYKCSPLPKECAKLGVK
jgi:hypothetical protein